PTTKQIPADCHLIATMVVLLVVMGFKGYLKQILHDAILHRALFLRSSSFCPSGRRAPSGATCRYSVWRVTPSSAQRSRIIVSGLPIDARAKRSLAVVIL